MICSGGDPSRRFGDVAELEECRERFVAGVAPKFDRGPGLSWIFSGAFGEARFFGKEGDDCRFVVVDKEEGIINCYPTAGCFGHCSFVPIAKVGQLSVCK